jgi:hypothetical protein
VLSVEEQKVFLEYLERPKSWKETIEHESLVGIM